MQEEPSRMQEPRQMQEEPSRMQEEPSQNQEEPSQMQEHMINAGQQAGDLQRQQNQLHKEYMEVYEESKRAELDVQQLPPEMQESTLHLLRKMTQDLMQEKMAALLEISPRKTALEQEAQRLRTLLYPVSPAFLAKLNNKIAPKE